MKCQQCNIETINPKFCSRKCSTTFNNTRFPKRQRTSKRYNCLFCNGKMGTGYKFCSLQCQITYKKKRTEKQILENKNISHHRMRKFLIDRDGAKCSLCGWSEKNVITGNVPVELDHINGHSDETILTNVRLLCPNCSSIQSTYKALNKGKGNPKRRRFYNGRLYGQASISPVVSTH